MIPIMIRSMIFPCHGYENAELLVISDDTRKRKGKCSSHLTRQGSIHSEVRGWQGEDLP
jgi:hypothetical protein